MFWQTKSLCIPLLCEVNLFTKFPECLGYYFIAYCCNFLHQYPQIIFSHRTLIVTLMNRSKVLQELSLQVLLVLWLVLVDVTVGHLSSLNYILVFYFFMHFLACSCAFSVFFGRFCLCTFASIFSLGFVNPPFSIVLGQKRPPLSVFFL